MPKLPKIAIVGRPNVGKSSLFNRICKTRIAIVDEAEGITRDRLYAESDHFGRRFEVIDTGGINPRSIAVFNELILRQAEIAIEEADSIIMVVDSKTGITDLDKDVAKVLHRTKKPLCLAVNKIDNLDNEGLIHEFHALGIEKIVAVSATQSWQIAELLEKALCDVPIQEEVEEEAPGIRVSIIGRANVGKSSLINYLLDENRCIVSPIPGTTRDSIDVTVTREGETYTLIDTAGIRRKGAEHEAVDKFAAIRTKKAIDRSDICLLMLDSQRGLTTQEKRIAKMIEDEGKGCIILFNKWDLVKGFRMEHCLKDVEDEVPFLKHCPKVMISALTGRNIDKIFPLIQECYAASKFRITTGELNKFIEGAIQRNHPPMLQGKRLRIYYMAQVGIQPPRFVMFVNYSNLMADSYQKYLYNQFREVFKFTGVPLNFHLRGKAKIGKEARLHEKSLSRDKRYEAEDVDVEEAEEEDPFDDEVFEEDSSVEE
jgi:GTP-binding protein